MKLRERLLLTCGILASAALFVAVFQGQERLIFGGKSHHFFPSHDKFLPQQPAQTAASSRAPPPPPAAQTQDFSHLLRLIEQYGKPNLFLLPPDHPQKLYRSKNPQSNPSVSEIINIKIRANASNWEKFQLNIRRNELYAVDDPTVEELLKDMTNLPITHVEQKEGGTQLKLIVDFQNSGQALLKLMRFEREQETLPNHFYFTDFERHNAEIAAFHLDRILDFRRAVPVVGRLFNITGELYEMAEGDDLLKTFFISPAGNVCFHGKCSYYCDTSHAFCGRPDTIEGSLAAFLPPTDYVPRKAWRHPYRRSYHKRKKAAWETNPNYCEQQVKQQPIFQRGRRLLDLMDLATFDFLMGNMDRHHYELFTIYNNDSVVIHVDHGRAFGRPNHDELSILAPIAQCCLFRQSTLIKLIELQQGPKKLSQLMKESLERDPLTPILLDSHLLALDRRLNILLNTVNYCVDTKGFSHVIIDDSA